MTVLNDKQILELCNNGMITPYERQQVRQINGEKVISYGVSSFGYDVTLGNNVDLFIATDKPIDPKHFDSSCLERLHVMNAPHGDGYVVVMPPHSYALGHTVETFDIPSDVLVVCLGKSTYARSGLIVNTTPAEPGWRGQITLEFANPTPLPIFLYVGEGICQFVFYRGERPSVTYATREGGPGKYQGQVGITLPRV